MERLNMHSPDLTGRTSTRSPNCSQPLSPRRRRRRQPRTRHRLRPAPPGALRPVVEGPQERYQLDWPGKREALFAANAPIAKTLRPVREESVDFDTTRNLFIEGDNLEALKLLQESLPRQGQADLHRPALQHGQRLHLRGRLRRFSGDYLERSGQVDDEGDASSPTPSRTAAFTPTG